jgi:hypothetical protein
MGAVNYIRTTALLAADVVNRRLPRHNVSPRIIMGLWRITARVPINPPVWPDRIFLSPAQCAVAECRASLALVPIVATPSAVAGAGLGWPPSGC